jgi:DNA-binding beta-propeller fold protein YncE
MKTLSALLVALLAATGVSQAASTNEYRVAGKIVVGGAGHWDYLTADAAQHRLYMTHNARVEVIDTASGHRVGAVAIGGYARGVVIVHEANRGYVTSGTGPLSPSKAHEVVAFDLKTLAVVQRIAVGADPDGIIYEPASKNVVAFTGESHSVVIIEPKTGHVVKTVTLDGSPEGSAIDGKGSVFFALTDEKKPPVIAEFDTASLSVKQTWPLAAAHCEEPSGIAMNTGTHRLFVACRNKVLAVLNAESGAVITQVPIAAENDGAVYDPQTHTIFVSTLDGTLSIVRETDGDHYASVQNLATGFGSRTLALDPSTHIVYISSALAGKKTGKYPTPAVGSFRALMIEASKP